MTVAREDARAVSEEIKAAVEAILAARGMEITKLTTNYGDRYGFKLEASPVVRGEGGVNLESPYAKAYKRFHESYGLKSGLLGKSFVNNGRSFVFTGIATSRSKYPLAAVSEDSGDTYFFPTTLAPELNK
jgi:hypothetical protein